jgi:signal transduction histidine kinase
MIKALVRDSSVIRMLDLTVYPREKINAGKVLHELATSVVEVQRETPSRVFKELQDYTKSLPPPPWSNEAFYVQCVPRC